jgi:polyferredoxin
MMKRPVKEVLGDLLQRARRLHLIQAKRLNLIQTRRLYAQTAAAVITNSYFLAPYLKYVPCPTLNCYACPLANFACPIGSLQHFAAIGIFPFLLLGILFLVGALVGRWACGYLCPFGLFQDLLARLRRKKYSPPDWLGWGRYVMLIGAALIIAAVTQEPWFCKLCPAGTLEAGIPFVLGGIFHVKLPGQPAQIFAMIGWLFYLKLAITAAVVAAAVYIKRPFCRFLCPLGAIFGVFNRVSLLRIKVDHHAHHDRADCRKLCPVDLDIRKDPGSAKCVRCMHCITCPGVKQDIH